MFDHFIESMFVPFWAIEAPVIRTRINAPAILSEYENHSLNQYLRQNFGYSRSDAVQGLLNNHPAFQGKTPHEVMFWLSLVLKLSSIEDLAKDLAKYGAQFLET